VKTLVELQSRKQCHERNFAERGSSKKRATRLATQQVITQGKFEMTVNHMKRKLGKRRGQLGSQPGKADQIVKKRSPIQTSGGDADTVLRASVKKTCDVDGNFHVSPEKISSKRKKEASVTPQPSKIVRTSRGVLSSVSKKRHSSTAGLCGEARSNESSLPQRKLRLESIEKG